jgi:hypothetical protein
MSPEPSKPSKNPKYRQYAFGAVLGAILLYFAGEWLIENVVQGPVQAARLKTSSLKREIRKKEKSVQQAKQLRQILDRLESQSLPSDAQVARSLYQQWLFELVQDVELENPSVNSNEPASRKGIYQTLSFSVRGRGTLDKLTQFLFAFYRTDLLHQIRSINIIPLSSDDRLDLSMAIEAMVLPNATAGQGNDATQETIFEEFRRRAWRSSTRLASADLVAYEPIIQRNLFGIGAAPDPTDQAYLTSISMVDGKPEVWITLRTSDEVLRLSVGEPFVIGSVAGTLDEVLGSDVVIESDGERWLLSLGEKLTDAFALPPEL